MICTFNLDELEQLLHMEHTNPHHLLGMHQVTKNNKKYLAVRAYVPNAKTIMLVPEDQGKKEMPMTKIHEEGFFELVMEEQDFFRYRLKMEDGEQNCWTCNDPYAYLPYLGELDKYLFAQSTHYELFNKMGAHRVCHQQTEGVLFCVWAPNAKMVSVIGDFNTWDRRRHMMRLRENSGIWELFIPQLENMERYKFEIRDQHDRWFQKSDPYGFFFETRPKNANIVYDLHAYEWKDQVWMSERKGKNLDQALNIYELHLGSYKRKENNEFLTYRELAHDLIPYIKDMNYTHVELLPILEHPYDPSWGYQVSGYYAPTSRFGEPDDFKYFVDMCHQHHIGVIMDWVPAHFPKDAFALSKFDGSCLYEHANEKQGEHPHWGTLIFNYGRNEVKNFLIGNALFWVEIYHIDGIRVDAVASMLYLDYGKKNGEWIPNRYGGRENLEAVEFLKHLNSIVLSKHPGVLMIAEESTSWPNVTKPPYMGGLGFSLKWNMGWMNDFLRYMETDPIYRKYHHHDLTFSMLYAFTENFILVLSHDEVVHGKKSMIEKMPGDLWQKFANLRVAYGFMMLHVGKKLLFMSQEFAQFSEWREDQSIDWHLLSFDHHQKMQYYVKMLNRLYVDNPLLYENDFYPESFEWIDADNAKQSVILFLRKNRQNPTEFLLVSCNFTPVTRNHFQIGVPFPGTYEEIFNSDDNNYFGSGCLNQGDIVTQQVPYHHKEQSMTITLAPLSIQIFKLKKK